MTEPTKEQIERARHLLDNIVVGAVLESVKPLLVDKIASALAAERDAGWNAAVEYLAAGFDQRGYPEPAETIRALKRSVTP